MLASLPSHTNGVLSVETGVMVPVMVNSVRVLSSLVSDMALATRMQRLFERIETPSATTSERAV